MTTELPTDVTVEEICKGFQYSEQECTTDISNCQMLCRTHNRVKGNR